MADHPLFVRVGDGALFQFGHRPEGALHPRLHAGKEVLREIDAAEVDGQPEIRKFNVALLEALPEFFARWHGKTPFPFPQPVQPKAAWPGFLTDGRSRRREEADGPHFHILRLSMTPVGRGSCRAVIKPEVSARQEPRPTGSR